MRAKQVATLLLATLFLAFCFQEAESSLKLLKLLKAGLILKALSPNKIILPIPIPIPIPTKGHNEHHNDHGGYQDYGHHGGYHDYGHHGGYHDYGHHGGYGYGHQPVVYHSTGWYLDKHGWH